MKRSSLRCPIPEDIREKLSADPFMKTCCIASEECEGRIEWHHALTFAGKRISEAFAVLPLCHIHHLRESKYRNELNKILVSRATEEQLAPYCKSTDYIFIKRSLVVK